MLLLQSIKLTQFKNYSGRGLEFRERIIGISGRNGVGKTNLLDAIYYLCFTKSYFTRSDLQNVQKGSGGFRIEGEFLLHNEPVTAICILRETGRKEFEFDGDPYERFAFHIGKLPCVIIAPDDVEIITGSSENRRRFMDAILSQIDAAYLQSLMDYNKVVQQRNGYLKLYGERRISDNKLLEIYDRQLILHGESVYEKRKKFLNQFIPRVQRLYQKIAGTTEMVDIKYESALNETSFENLLVLFREKDHFLQRTNGGIHKDDLEISFMENSFKNIASQGQRKSLLFALKLAEFEIIREVKGFSPILLLDDVFEKLDDQRMHNLLDWVCVQNEGQIFITDTHDERIIDHFDKLSMPYQLVRL